MIRRTIVAGNWKLNKNAAETRRFFIEFRNKLAGIQSRADVVICPAFVSLETAVDAAKDTAIATGAQNVYWESSGAFTGEISPEMLESIGVRYVLLGHSERRALFGETDEQVNRKLRAVLTTGLIPIVCVGEVLEQRERGETETVVSGQVSAALKDIAPDHAGRIVVAYEPVWAIGTGKTASPKEANDVHALIRRTIDGIFGGAAADGTSILYGGSVKPDNAASLMSESDIDGVLVGGASLDPATFAAIVESAH